jgi:hypothetical protein
MNKELVNHMYKEGKEILSVVVKSNGQLSCLEVLLYIYRTSLTNTNVVVANESNFTNLFIVQ